MNWLRQFMVGRYGSDQLNIGILVVGMILSFTANVFSSTILVILSYIVFGLFIYRVFSKDVNKRQQENYKFLAVWTPISQNLIGKVSRAKEYKTYRYFKCPNCKQMLRVPAGRGKIMITCNKCSNKFEKTT